MSKAARCAVVGLILVTLAFLATGCAWFEQQTQEPPAQVAAPAPSPASSDTQAPPPPRAPQEPVGRYYEFDDVQIPRELTLIKDSSILFRVGAFSAGVLVFKGNVDSESLLNFFTEAMAKDNWTLKSSFKYPKSALFFGKKGKVCIISIMEHTFTTNVEIWVAPAD